MPKVFQDFSDDRNKSWCIHCGGWLSQSPVTRDHTPSKVLLDKPYPDNLAITPVCKPCNNGFSLDEEYLAIILSCILSGSTEPSAQKNAAIGRALSRNTSLRAGIEIERSEQFLIFGGSQIELYPYIERIRRVVVKNARAHLFYENGEPMLGEPEKVSICPIPSMEDWQLGEFLARDPLEPWCEVGSRWNFRLVEDGCFDKHGFVVLQPGVYRYRVEAGGMGIRTVIREYLATSVFW